MNTPTSPDTIPPLMLPLPGPVFPGVTARKLLFRGDVEAVPPD